MSKLFNNPGQKLKVVSMVWFWLIVVAAVILAFTSCGLNRSDFYPIPFFGYLIGGCVGAYLTALPLYAFGELVENSTANAETNEEVLSQLNKQNTSVSSAPAEATWVCGNCNAENSSNHAICKKCGQYRHSS